MWTEFKSCAYWLQLHLSVPSSFDLSISFSRLSLGGPQPATKRISSRSIAYYKSTLTLYLFKIMRFFRTSTSSPRHTHKHYPEAHAQQLRGAGQSGPSFCSDLLLLFSSCQFVQQFLRHDMEKVQVHRPIGKELSEKDDDIFARPIFQKKKNASLKSLTDSLPTATQRQFAADDIVYVRSHCSVHCRDASPDKAYNDAHRSEGWQGQQGQISGHS